MSEFEAASTPALRSWYRREDWVAVIIGLGLLTLAILCIVFGSPPSVEKLKHPWSSVIGHPGAWNADPLESFRGKWWPLAGSFALCLLCFSLATAMLGRSVRAFIIAFPIVFLLATFAYWMEQQATIKHLNLASPLWAILIGLLISNTVGVANWLRPGVATELYIKTGLVVLGGDVLFHKLVALGIPGFFVAWVVTPIVLITTYWFGQRVLRMESKTLNMVICADMSVCGVSAAIAAAASCRAKKEELSLAISMSLVFTVGMMIVMPLIVNWLGLDPYVAGAWIGGTVDSTGAVAAAGKAIGEEAATTAVTIKMIQNILIGFVSLGIATYWVVFVDRDRSNEKFAEKPTVKPGIIEIWHRFPRFIIGFLIASVSFTLVSNYIDGGEAIIEATQRGATVGLRIGSFVWRSLASDWTLAFRNSSPKCEEANPCCCTFAANHSISF